MVPSRDVAETTAFFTEILKFKVILNSADYCIVGHGEFEIHIQTAEATVGQMSFYMEVDDLDQVWSLIQEVKTDLKLRPPFEQAYGMREIHLQVPATKALLFIGQAC
ncbi:hypothetical protein Caka_0281 [Coraliomargarita akajimensis DSM 45221]|uniref:Glyoxalase/bleomycin resistance protein/dioxygenase n=2 Tax=Coraliomargarita TaxID=442430 RepID=D5ELY2_CORAD|nr:hypothetical protein Caka_0281 [Coraliomargarita akajimensis DSM 45221]